MSQSSSPCVPITHVADAEAIAADDKPARKIAIEPWTKPVINLILVGETGVGKTSLVDFLTNVCAGATLEEFEAKIDFNNELTDKFSAASRTIEPRFYSIVCASGQTVNILDTPGLADARGTDKDNEHKEAIAHSIRDNFNAVDAIVILTNGTVTRLSADTAYALETISSMFPKSMVDNITFVFTAVPHPMSFCFDTASLPQELRNVPMLSIDNPYVQWFKYQKMLAQEVPADEEVFEDMNDHVHRGYNRALKTLSRLFQYLDKCKIQPTHNISELYTVSTAIEALISDVARSLGSMEEKRTSLKHLQAELQEQAHVMNLEQRYERVVNTPVYEMEDTASEHNVLCVAGSCYSNCILQCTSPFTLDTEALATSICFEETPGVALSKRRCEVCGHIAEDHKHYRAKWVQKMRTESVIDTESKKRYDTARTEFERTTCVKEITQHQIAELERVIAGSVEKVAALCEKYNKLSLSGNFIRHILSATCMLKLREAYVLKMEGSIEEKDKISKWIKHLEGKKIVLEEVEKRGKTILHSGGA
ncbi:hypothetical protein J3R30DRAFT_49993 [Lentinula aciculospora]|uniref:AIG1-type G domain-containing protein n=1 Tax=Lentinula aciculospora TaxID=153920 RepID=A0A9W9ATK4_9AGAR|nr:hypothetical protein J3R30DRAFT_49993 [Lentinula aciculospora]